MLIQNTEDIQPFLSRRITVSLAVSNGEFFGTVASGKYTRIRSRRTVLDEAFFYRFVISASQPGRERTQRKR